MSWDSSNVYGDPTSVPINGAGDLVAAISNTQHVLLGAVLSNATASPITATFTSGAGATLLTTIEVPANATVVLPASPVGYVASAVGAKLSITGASLTGHAIVGSRNYA